MHNPTPPAPPPPQQQQQQAPPKTPVPPHFSLCPTPLVTTLVSTMLTRLTSHNDRIPLSSSNITRFHSRAPPSIKLDEYLTRIVKFAGVEKSVVLLLLVYIDRICEVHRGFVVSSLTVHRLIISSLTTGSKALSDIYCTNTYYAKVGGISLQELNIMELEFCKLTGWRLAADVEILQRYYVNLVRTHAGFVMVGEEEWRGLLNEREKKEGETESDSPKSDNRNQSGIPNERLRTENVTHVESVEQPE